MTGQSRTTPGTIRAALTHQGVRHAPLLSSQVGLCRQRRKPVRTLCPQCRFPLRRKDPVRSMANTADIVETRLDNGLKVLTREVRHAPIVSFYVWYRVGGRNERPGITGISHWAEHMLFKGTPTLKKGDIGNLVETHGGSWNGFTWVDFTAYFETLPSQHLDPRHPHRIRPPGQRPLRPRRGGVRAHGDYLRARGRREPAVLPPARRDHGRSVQGPPLRSAGRGLEERPAPDHPRGPVRLLPDLLHAQQRHRGRRRRLRYGRPAEASRGRLRPHSGRPLATAGALGRAAPGRRAPRHGTPAGTGAVHAGALPHSRPGPSRRHSPSRSPPACSGPGAAPGSTKLL